MNEAIGINHRFCTQQLPAFAFLNTSTCLASLLVELCGDVHAILSTFENAANETFRTIV
jgi:hypothetical protein